MRHATTRRVRIARFGRACRAGAGTVCHACAAERRAQGGVSKGWMDMVHGCMQGNRVHMRAQLSWRANAGGREVLGGRERGRCPFRPPLRRGSHSKSIRTVRSPDASGGSAATRTHPRSKWIPCGLGRLPEPHTFLCCFPLLRSSNPPPLRELLPRSSQRYCVAVDGPTTLCIPTTLL